MEVPSLKRQGCDRKNQKLSGSVPGAYQVKYRRKRSIPAQDKKCRRINPNKTRFGIMAGCIQPPLRRKCGQHQSGQTMRPRSDLFVDKYKIYLDPFEGEKTEG